MVASTLATVRMLPSEAGGPRPRIGPAALRPPVRPRRVTSALARAVILALAAVPALAAGLPGLVTTAAAGGPVARDTFPRSTTGGWGTAELGGPWSAIETTTGLSVADGKGIMVLPAAGASRGLAQTGLTARDQELVVRARIDRMPRDSSVYVYLVGRRGGGSEYRLKVRIAPSGAVFLQPTRVVDGTEQDVGAEVSPAGVTVTPNSDVRIRGLLTGASPTRLRYRAWNVSATEPADWTIDRTDGTRELQDAGHPALRSHLSSRATNAPVSVRFDDWRVTDLGDAAGSALRRPCRRGRHRVVRGLR